MTIGLVGFALAAGLAATDSFGAQSAPDRSPWATGMTFTRTAVYEHSNSDVVAAVAAARGRSSADLGGGKSAFGAGANVSN